MNDSRPDCENFVCEQLLVEREYDGDLGVCLPYRPRSWLCGRLSGDPAPLRGDGGRDREVR